MAEAPAKPKDRFVFIDGLRAIAALAVLFHHEYISEFERPLSNTFPSFIRSLLKDDTQRMELFFVISGFVIAFSLRSTIVTAASGFNFILRRQVRLDPAYWLCLAIAYFHVLGQALAHPVYWPLVPHAGTVLLNVLYLHNVTDHEQMMSVSWTLCLEVQLYLIYILAMLLIQRLIAWFNIRPARQEFAYMAVIVPMMLVSLWSRSRMRQDIWFTPIWCVFGMGAVVYWTMERWISVKSLAAIALIDVLWSIWTADQHAFSCACIAGLIFLASRTGGLTTWCRQRFFQYFARISYSLYLSHRDIGHALMRAGVRMTGMSRASAVFWYFTTIAVCIGVAHILNILVEQPSIRLAARLKPRSSKPVVAAPVLLPGVVNAEG
jgi:peptidoglycan/LPS O-acetylase OafA/YrhL